MIPRKLQQGLGRGRRAPGGCARGRGERAAARMPAARASGGGAYSSNLGVLAPTAVPDAAPAIEIDPYLSQRVSPERCGTLPPRPASQAPRRAARPRATPSQRGAPNPGLIGARPPLPLPSFANRGFAVDGGTAFVNAALLLLLVALATERIFGLNKARARLLGGSASPGCRWAHSAVPTSLHDNPQAPHASMQCEHMPARTLTPTGGPTGNAPNPGHQRGAAQVGRFPQRGEAVRRL